MSGTCNANKRIRLMKSSQVSLDAPDKECAATLMALSISEILQEIFRNLDIQSKGRAAQVARSWLDVSVLPQLWNNVPVNLLYSEGHPSYYKIFPKGGFRRSNLSRQPKYRSFPFITNLNLLRVHKLTVKTIHLIVQRFRNLVVLDIDVKNTGVNDAALTLIAGGLNSLKHLNLGLCLSITDVGLATLCGFDGVDSNGHVPALQSLSLWGICEFTTKALEYLSLGQPALRNLDVSFCDGVRNEGLEFLSRLINLRVLDLSRCRGISDDGMVHLSRMANLTDLNLTGNKISRVGLNLLASGDSRLTSLSLESCDMVDDQCGQPLARLTHLTILKLRQTNIRDSVLRCLADGPGASEIDTLDLSGCRLTDEVGIHLARMINLRIIHLDYTRISDVCLGHLASPVDSKIEIIHLNKPITKIGFIHLACLPRLHRVKYD